MNINQETIILKIGGSVVTQKHRAGVYIRRRLLARIAGELAEVLRKNKDIRLFIIHGAGAGGHQLAKQYDLEDGTKGNQKKLYGALATRIACQELNLAIADIFLKNGLMVVSVHTASFIIQKDKRIISRSFDIIDHALGLNCIPIMYGEMVFDKTLGMSVCSGDAIAMTLAKKYNATKIVFASDIDGIYDKDPHIHSDAKLIDFTTLQSIVSDKEVALSGSHNIDVTGGLENKIAVLASGDIPKSLKTVVVCNGIKEGILTRVLTYSNEGTVIKI